MEFISKMFPQGLRVLVVDESFICLKSIETSLKQCGYQVTIAMSAEFALDLLRKNKQNFDIVITDIKTGEMNGFRLSDIIALEMDIPVLMMCQGNDRGTLMQCLEHGACGYLMKPPMLKEIENIWHYVLKHKKNKSTLSDLDIQKNETERNLNMIDEASGQKTRISWSDPELHAKFVEACHKLGDKAVPSKILLEMNVPGLTRDHVASHLQKYRKKMKTQSQKADNIPASYVPKPTFKDRMNKYFFDLKYNRPETSQSSYYGVTPSNYFHPFVNPQPHCLPSTHFTRSGYGELTNLVAPSVLPMLESQGADQISWLENPQSFFETDNINYHLGRHSSAGDELSAVIRPYQRQ